MMRNSIILGKGAREGEIQSGLPRARGVSGFWQRQGQAKKRCQARRGGHSKPDS